MQKIVPEMGPQMIFSWWFTRVDRIKNIALKNRYERKAVNNLKMHWMETDLTSSDKSGATFESGAAMAAHLPGEKIANSREPNLGMYTLEN